MSYIDLLRTHDIYVAKLYSKLLELDEDETVELVTNKMIGTSNKKNNRRCFGFTQKHGQPRCNLKIICSEDTLYCAKHLKTVKDPTVEQPIQINIKVRDTEILNVIVKHFKMNKKDCTKRMGKKIYYPNCCFTKEGSHPAGIMPIEQNIPICWNHKDMVNDGDMKIQIVDKKKKKLSDIESMIKNSFASPYVRIFVHKDEQGLSSLVARSGKTVTYKSLIQK